MPIMCTHFDEWLCRWYADIFALCAVLLPDSDVVQEAVFQTFLRLGAANPPCAEAAEDLLYRYAVDLCRAHVARKRMRRKYSESGADTEVRAYLRMPFSRRAAAYLTHAAGLSPARTGAALRCSAGRAAKLANMPAAESLSAICAQFRPNDADAMRVLSDRIYTRFEGRSVALECRFGDAKNAFDRLAPWLALLALALFAAAILYTGSISATLPV